MKYKQQDRPKKFDGGDTDGRDDGWGERPRPGWWFRRPRRNILVHKLQIDENREGPHRTQIVQMTDCGAVGAATWQLRICSRATNFEEKWNKRLLRRGRRNQHAGRVCSPELPASLPQVKIQSLHRKGLPNQNPLSP